MANFKFEPIFVGAGFELGNDKNVTEPTQQSQDKLESLSFSITSIGELTSSFKTDAGKLLGSLADRSPNSTFDELSQLYHGRSFDLRDPLFVETPKLAELVKERCVPEGNSPAIPFKDVLAPPSDSQSVASSNPDFKILSDSSQGMSDSYSLSLDNDRIVKYLYQQTTTLEFNEKNIIITHENGNILTLSATKNPYQGYVSYKVVNDDAKNLGEAWNHDLKDIVVMFLTTGKLETENHDDGNVWRIPSDAETKKSEPINFLKDVAEGVKAKVAAEVEASEAEEGDAKLQGPTKEEVNSEAPAAQVGSAQASEHSSISESAGNIQVVDSLAALANPAQQVETRSQAPSDIPASSNSSQTTQSDGQTQIYKKGTPIANVLLKNATAKAAEYPTLDKHTSITSVADIIQKVKEAGGQALVHLNLRSGAITDQRDNGWTSRIIDLIDPPQAEYSRDFYPTWATKHQSERKGIDRKAILANTSCAAIHEGDDGKYYLVMTDYGLTRDTNTDRDKAEAIVKGGRDFLPKLVLPFKDKNDALSCIAYLTNNQGQIIDLLGKLIPTFAPVVEKLSGLYQPRNFERGPYFFDYC